jgi:TfoX/Sxy family transcriptional regulator of competence genes
MVAVVRAAVETLEMAYDDELVNRVRALLTSTDAVTELQMFGGWGVTVHGNMAVGVMNDDLIVRVGSDGYEAALARPGVRPFDFTGRPMTGWIYVEGSAVATGRTLGRWVRAGLDFAQSLPPKAKSATRRPVR